MLVLAVVLIPSAMLLRPAKARTERDTPAVELARAGRGYDVLTRRGLTSFHCELKPDWPAFIEASLRIGGQSGGEVPSDDPVVRYFSDSRMTIDDDMVAGTTVAISGMGPTPPELPDALARRLAEAVQLTARMFFDFWNPLANGSLWNGRRDDVEVQRQGHELRMVDMSPEAVVTETLVSKGHLTAYHAHVDGYDAPVFPEFQASKDGLKVEAMHIVFKNPATQAIQYVTLRVSYAAVSGFDLPSAFTTSIDDVGAFQAKLTGCTVRTNR